MTPGTITDLPRPRWTLQDDISRAGLDPDTIGRVTNRALAQNAEAVAAGAIRRSPGLAGLVAVEVAEAAPA